jgi:adenosylcobinamide kinase/adenosylcobinamide-phosphate guanylyltransferase
VAGLGEEAVHREVEALLTDPPCPVLVVTNEVGSGVHPHGELALRFVDVLGTTNQLAARLADEVILMVAGQPLVVKGPGAR